MACFFSIPFSNNPYITPWGTIDPDHEERYIQPGDTLTGIAREYNTSVESILEANPGIDPDFLRIGQRLCIIGYRVQPYDGPWPSEGSGPENA